MTTTIIKRLFRTASAWWRLWAVAVVLLAGLWAGYRPESPVLTTFRTTDGWGYRISDPNGKIRICQPYIPALEEQMPFRSEKDARTVGTQVLRRLKSRQRLTVTRRDLLKWGILCGDVPAAEASGSGTGKNS